MSSELSKPDRDRYASLNRIIKAGKDAFMRVGAALMEVRDKRLYRGEYGTFEAFCQEKHGLTRRRADQLIEAAGVAAEVAGNEKKITQTSLPNEAQARALKDAPAGERRGVFEEAQRTAPKGRVTAKHVERVVAMRRQPEPSPAPEETEDQGFVDVDPPPEKATPPQKPGWQVVAEATDEIIADLRAVAAKMRRAFGIRGEEVTNPHARRFTRIGTVGAINELVRNMEMDKPVGEDAGGIVTQRDVDKRAALERKAS